MDDDRGSDRHTAGTGADAIDNAEPRAIAIAAATADLLAARAAALGISVGELIAVLASATAPAAPAKSASPPPSNGAGNAHWSEVKAWIDSWGKPDELPRPKLGK